LRLKKIGKNWQNWQKKFEREENIKIGKNWQNWQFRKKKNWQNWQKLAELAKLAN
jgi:hypothetical protein